MRNKTGNMEKTLKRVQGDISGLCKTSNKPTCVALQGDKLGFTVAEVLITIGIIGVVAALTIPTLVNNYQTRSWNISSSNFEAKFGEALKIMNTQHSLSNLGTTERFVNELQKHMKVAKVCNNEKLTLCFPDEISYSLDVVDIALKKYVGEIKNINPDEMLTSAALGQKDWNTNTMGVQFANGVSAILAYNPKCSANPFDVNAVTVSGDKENITFGTDCVAMIYDVTSNAEPNTLNKDIRMSAQASIEQNCLFKINGKCATKLVPPGNLANKEKCEEMVSNGMLTGGLASCPVENDYFAGAVNICGGLDKVISRDDLTNLANYIYEDTSLISSKLESLNLNKIPLYLWSNSKGATAIYVYGAYFYDDKYTTGYNNTGGGSRSRNDVSTICVE